MPSGGFSVTIGIDLAYTDDTSADWAVAVVLMHFGDESRVLEVLRDQTTAPKFAKQLRELRRRWKGAPMYSIFYGAEKGSIDFMRTLGIPIKGLKRPGDKFSRSQKTAAAWNEGKILIPQAVTVTDDYSENTRGQTVRRSGDAVHRRQRRQRRRRGCACCCLRRSRKIDGSQARHSQGAGPAHTKGKSRSAGANPSEMDLT